MDAAELFESCFEWLIANYSTFRFFTERDIVWTLQRRIVEVNSEQNLNFRVFNDYPILPGPRRGLSADLAILKPEGLIEVAVEFKYEPSHFRSNIPKSKFPVCFWGIEGVARDVIRVREFVESGKVRRAYSCFIDEGGYFRRKAAHPGSSWEDREVGGGLIISLLVSRAVARN